LLANIAPNKFPFLVLFIAAIPAGFHYALDMFLPVQVCIAVPRLNPISNDYPCSSNCLQIVHQKSIKNYFIDGAFTIMRRKCVFRYYQLCRNILFLAYKFLDTVQNHYPESCSYYHIFLYIKIILVLLESVQFSLAGAGACALYSLVLLLIAKYEQKPSDSRYSGEVLLLTSCVFCSIGPWLVLYYYLDTEYLKMLVN
jgi:hypothetical protein